MKHLYKHLFVISLLLIALLYSIKSYSQQSFFENKCPKANYNLAERFSKTEVNKMLFSTTVQPHWLKKSSFFWYSFKTSKGRNWYLIDASKMKKEPLFDNDIMASFITTITQDPVDAKDIPIDSIYFPAGTDSFCFTYTTHQNVPNEKYPYHPKTFYFSYLLKQQQLHPLSGLYPPRKAPDWANISPDSTYVVFLRRHNLFYMNKKDYIKALLNPNDTTIIEHQLTSDGIKDFSYGLGFYDTNDNQLDNEQEEATQGDRKPVSINWSPSSHYFAMIRTDNRKVKNLWVINSLANPRPTLETYKYAMAGDSNQYIQHLIIFSISQNTHQEINIQTYKDQTLYLWSLPNMYKNMDQTYIPTLWDGDTTTFYVSAVSRDEHELTLYKINATNGERSSILQEHSLVDLSYTAPYIINEGKDIIEWSERDGWAHFYLYDNNGVLKNKITTGNCHDENIIGIDNKNHTIYFTSYGREAKEDPYYQHLYSIHTDGTHIMLLNHGNGNHQTYMNANHLFLVDNMSSVNSSSKALFYNLGLHQTLPLDTTDLSILFANGYKFPEPFTTKAADGITNLYGVMYKPFDFDPKKKYPLIEYVYPGPQVEEVNTSFTPPQLRTDQLAQLGFIVITVGNRGGSPLRSEWYHKFGYNHLRDYGLADKKHVAEELSALYPFIDISKVGIYGHSGGGFMAAAAMMVYPDFYKVGISSSGNHDNRIYNRWWGEREQGIETYINSKGDTSFVYTVETNQDIAKNLKGHLLLTTGDIDNNVNPAMTYRLINALIHTHKRFDFLLLPGQKHGYGDMNEYFFWKMADYFSYYLMGDHTPRPVNILEMNINNPQH